MILKASLKFNAYTKAKECEVTLRRESEKLLPFVSGVHRGDNKKVVQFSVEGADDSECIERVKKVAKGYLWRESVAWETTDKEREDLFGQGSTDYISRAQGKLEVLLSELRSHCATPVIPVLESALRDLAKTTN